MPWCQRRSVGAASCGGQLLPAWTVGRAVTAGGLLAVMWPAHRLAVQRVERCATVPARDDVVDVLRRHRTAGDRAVRACRQEVSTKTAPTVRRVKRITGHMENSRCCL